MSQTNDLDAIRQQANRLFQQRVMFATHTALLLIAIMLSEGQLLFRYRLAMVMWLVLWMLHGVILVLFELRESAVRRAIQDGGVEKRKRDDGAYYTLGEDGELTPLEEETPRRQRR